MRCHYEVLEVHFEATDADIKTSYRKLALKLHPDKNLDNAEQAKQQFQEVQQAYEVLSDKQERAWYDNHREQILRGANSEFQDKSLDVFQYFTTACFKGYEDDENGFYTVYRTVFDEIAKEDIEFMDDKEQFCEIPCFGNSQSDYDNFVGPFYAYWLNYSTKKSYTWLDPYDIREGKGDRRVLKLIEKENKKARQKARKERNDEIRNLVAFVRKRDKRVQQKTKQLEQKAVENRKKNQRLSTQKRLERHEQHKNEEQAEWLKFDNVKSELEEIERHLAAEFGEQLSNSDTEEESEDNLYCIACNKVFKTPKAFENHEFSKKHKENVAKLKQTMLDEEEESVISKDSEGFDSDLNIESSHDTEMLTQESKGSRCSPDALLTLNESDMNVEEFDNSVKILDNPENENSEEIDSDIDHESQNRTSGKKKKKKLNKTVMKPQNIDNFETILNQANISEDDFDFSSSNTSKKSKKRSKKQTNGASKIVQNSDVADKNDFEDFSNKVIEEKRKRVKSKKEKSSKTKESLEGVDLSHCCVTCKSEFSSKNKLYEHLKVSGHGVYLPQKVKQQNVKENKSVKNRNK